MTEKLKEIIAAARGVSTTRQTQQRLADIVERLEQNGGLELKNFTPYSDPQSKTLADAVHDHDREMGKGFKTSFAKLPVNDATRRAYKGATPRMILDIQK